MPASRGQRDQVQLANSERRQPGDARPVEAAPASERLRVTIIVRRRLDGPPMPDQAYWMENRLGGRRYLSAGEFGERYGAAPEELSRVQEFARSAGLTVVESDVAGRRVVVEGTVTQMNAAFGVELRLFHSADNEYRSYEGPIQFPSEIAEVVVAVLGLDNRKVARRALIGGPAGAVPLTPPQVAQAYAFPAPAGAPGQTIGLIELAGGYQTSDIASFLGPLGVPTPTLTPVDVTGSNVMLGSLTDPNPADIEVTLDISVAAAIAPYAEIAVVFGDESLGGFAGAVNRAVNPQVGDPVSTVISISWAGVEEDWAGDPMDLNTMHQAIADAAVKGITIFVASGDEGSDCGVGDGLAHVFYPASDPGVTACGGTYTILGPPLQQGTWNDGGPQPPDYQPPGATGGGISTLTFPPEPALPVWQQGANIPKSVNDQHVGRGLPDIAGQASGYSGYVIVIYGQPITNIPIPGISQNFGAVGGTSETAPLYAGLTALINNALGQNVGFLNPTLYVLAEDPGAASLFTGIDDGVSNQWSIGAADASHSYVSGPGWNACTGWGIVNGSALLAAYSVWLFAEVMPSHF
jgi:kumamolisin